MSFIYWSVASALLLFYLSTASIKFNNAQVVVQQLFLAIHPSKARVTLCIKFWFKPHRKNRKLKSRAAISQPANSCDILVAPCCSRSNNLQRRQVVSIHHLKFLCALRFESLQHLLADTELFVAKSVSQTVS